MHSKCDIPPFLKKQTNKLQKPSFLISQNNPSFTILPSSELLDINCSPEKYSPCRYTYMYKNLLSRNI